MTVQPSPLMRALCGSYVNIKISTLTRRHACIIQVKVGFTAPGQWLPPGHVISLRTDVTSVTKSLTFLKVAGALYQVLELACKDYAKNALAFSERIELFDLHLGTDLQSVFLMRELFRNRRMLAVLDDSAVMRYTRMLDVHRKPAFVLLLRCGTNWNSSALRYKLVFITHAYTNTRSLVGCDGQPISANQQMVTQILLTELSRCLPRVKMVTINGDVHIMVAKHGKRAKDEAAEDWIDLAEFNGVFMNTEELSLSVASQSLWPPLTCNNRHLYFSLSMMGKS